MTLAFFEDLKKKELLPIKFLLFLQAAGDMALYPFLTLHMKYLGISVSDIGIQFAVSPVATLIATPLVGLLADKIGNFKIMLSISLLLCAAISQLFLLVPGVKTISIENNRNFLCEYKGENYSQLQLNSSLSDTVLNCEGFCEDNFVPVDFCFSNSLQENCVTSNITFQLENSNNTSLNIIYDNGTYDSIICKTTNYTCGLQCKTMKQIRDNHYKAITFWGYLAIRIGLFVIIATEMSLLKAAILTLLDKFDSDYGFQRLWASVAVCIVPPVTGVIMDKLQKGEVEDYRPSFYIYGGMKVFMAIVTLIIDISVKPPTMHIWKNLGKLLKNPEVDILLLYCAFIGSCWGFLETFFLWYMESLGASKSLMGLTFTVGAVSGIPITLVAGALARKFGHVSLISVGLFVYCGRFIGYSFIQTPYEALGLEALECITMTLMVITITTYANMLAGIELVATMQATWASLHFAVGRAIGSMMGGFLMEKLGTRMTYRVFAIMSVIMGILYIFLYRIWFIKRHKESSPVCDKTVNLNDIKAGEITKKISLDILNTAKDKTKYSDDKDDYDGMDKGTGLGDFQFKSKDVKYNKQQSNQNQEKNISGNENSGFDSTNL